MADENNTTTDADGNYSPGVKPGKYRVMFYTTDYNALHNTNYVNTYYGGAYFYPAATELTVNAGDALTGIDRFEFGRRPERQFKLVPRGHDGTGRT